MMSACTPIKPVTLDEAIKRFMLSTRDSIVIDLQAVNPATSMIPVKAFMLAYGNAVAEVGKNKKGEPSYKPVPQAWLEAKNRLSVFGLRYAPGAGRVFEEAGREWFNSFWMPSYKDVPIDPMHATSFLKHMELLVPVAEEREIVLDWLAHTLQRPGVRNKFALLMVAHHEGTGRGWLVEVMKRVLGAQNVKPIGMKEFEGAFHDGFIECLLNVVEEVCANNESKFIVSEEMKDHITAQSRVANKKYGAKEQVNLYNNILLQSNHTDALAVRDTDRRVMVVQTDAQPRSDVYYEALYALKDDPAFINSIGALLAARDLTAFERLTRAPETQAKTDMIDATTSDLDLIVDQFLTEAPGGFFLAEQALQFAQLSSDMPLNAANRVGKILERKARRVPGLKGNAMKLGRRVVRPWMKREKVNGHLPDREEVVASLAENTRWLGSLGPATFDDVAELQVMMS